MKTALAAFAAALIVSLLTTPQVMKLALRFGAVDQPDNNRRVHTEPKPRWGGIAIWLGIMTGVAAAWALGEMGGWFTLNRSIAALLIGGTVIAVAGAVDDRVGLSALWQALVIVAVSTGVTYFGVRIDYVTNPFGQSLIWLGWMSVPVTVVWLFGVTKTLDLIDGLDGLAAGVCAISALCLAALAFLKPIPGVTQPMAVVCVAVAGASLGFLRYNYPPAKIFMGTVGVQLMGFLIAGSAVLGAFKIAAAFAVLVPVLALAIPIFDAAFAVVRRAAAGKPVYLPDRGHIHHRLLDAGLTQTQAILVIYAATFLLSAAALAIALAGR